MGLRIVMVRRPRSELRARQSLPARPSFKAAHYTAGGPHKVRLHVYDLSETNWWGAYHSGIEVCGKEWSFGSFPEGSRRGTGVWWCLPRSAADSCSDAAMMFNQSVDMGDTTLSEDEVHAVVEEFKAASPWQASSYDMLRNNCNTFSDALCERLTGSWGAAFAGTFGFTGGDNNEGWCGMRSMASIGPEGRLSVVLEGKPPMQGKPPLSPGSATHGQQQPCSGESLSSMRTPKGIIVAPCGLAESDATTDVSGAVEANRDQNMALEGVLERPNLRRGAVGDGRNDKDVGELKRDGMLALRAGEVEWAIVILSRAIVKDPADPQLYGYRAAAYRAYGLDKLADRDHELEVQAMQAEDGRGQTPKCKAYQQQASVCSAYPSDCPVAELPLRLPSGETEDKRGLIGGARLRRVDAGLIATGNYVCLSPPMSPPPA